MKRYREIKDNKLQLIYDYVKNVTELDISKPTRRREYVDARALFYALASKWTRRSSIDIGSFLGKDHATVIHCKKLFYTVLYVQDEFMKKAYDSFDQEMINHNMLEELIEDVTNVDFAHKNTLLIDENTKLRATIQDLTFELQNVKDKLNSVSMFSEYVKDLNTNQIDRLRNKLEVMSKVMRQEKFIEVKQPKEMEGALL